MVSASIMSVVINFYGELKSIVKDFRPKTIILGIDINKKYIKLAKERLQIYANVTI